MYKAYKGNTVVDAMEDLQCVRFVEQQGVVRCREDDANGIISTDGNRIYHVEGWPEFPEGEYETVTLQQIGWDEFCSIRESLDSGLGVPVEPETPDQEEPKTTAQILQEQIDNVDSQVKLAARFASV